MSPLQAALSAIDARVRHWGEGADLDMLDGAVLVRATAAHFGDIDAASAEDERDLFLEAMPRPTTLPR